MEIINVCAAALAGVFAALAVRKYAPDVSAAAGFAAGAVIFIMVLSKAAPIIGEVRSIMSMADTDSSYFSVLLKTIGICAFCQFTSDTCRDNGQAAIASRVELAAKTGIILIALPMFRRILTAVSDLLGAV